MSHQIKASTGGHPAVITVSDSDWVQIKTLAHSTTGHLALSDGNASRDGDTEFNTLKYSGGYGSHKLSAKAIF